MKKYFECRDYKLELGNKTYIMGILNVTPDSFSDGGRYLGYKTAVERAKEMIAEGADIIDIGGESTRPGYRAVEAEEELQRVMPVLQVLLTELEVPISIDTNKKVVAEAALKAGAHIINDIWGLQKDQSIAEVAAKYNAGVIIMHNKEDKVYDDLIKEIKTFLKNSVKIAKGAGISNNSIIIDPGIGFGKTFEHNLEVMKKFKELRELGFPLLLATSRKSFIGNILGLPTTERIEGTIATVALGIAAGADVVRVHDVKEIYRAIKVTDRIIRNSVK